MTEARETLIFRTRRLFLNQIQKLYIYITQFYVEYGSQILQPG